MNPNLCNNCGGDYEYRHGRWICRSCGSYKPEELSNEEVTLLYTASQKLRLAEFDEAEQEFDDIVRKYPQNPNGYWGRLMSRYGIKYEEDFDGRRIPTCYATSMERVVDDPDYRKALEYADKETREYYTRQAEYMERVRKEWVEKARKEKPYDIFICYKDSDLANGIERTEDSVAAQELYIHLTNKGYRVFFSRESLRDKVGEKYEPYIFSALSTAKVMLVYGSKPEYITSTWLKNEWTRYEKRIKAGEKKPNSLLVACDGFSPARLPKTLATRQCFDAKQRSFFSDLDDVIAHIIREEKPAPVAAPAATAVQGRKRNKGVMFTAIAGVAVCAALAVVAVTTLGGQKTKNPTVVPPQETPLVTERVESGETDMDTVESDTTTRGDPGCNHEVVVDAAVAPTCTEPGLTEGAHCALCGGILTAQETLEALGHTTVTDEAVAPTCTRAGQTEGSHCSACNEVFTRPTYVAPKGHTYVGGTCTICGAQEIAVDESLFVFSELGDGTYSVAARDPESIFGHVVIPDMYNGKLVTEIGSFRQCSELTGMDIPASVIRIGSQAFYLCKELTDIVLPDGVTSIGTNAFDGCQKLTNIVLPDGITEIGEDAFEFCSSLTSITIPDGVTSISANAFNHCLCLASVTIPDSVVFIDDYAFHDCPSLTNITIPSGVTRIDTGAFANCSALEKISFAGTMEQWNEVRLDDLWVGEAEHGFFASTKVPATEVICSDGTVSLS